MVTKVNLEELQKDAVEIFTSGFACSESVIYAIRKHFENDLSDLDIELLAMGMTLAWLDQTLNSSELTLQFIRGKEEKYYSQANHIAELRALREDTKLEMQKLHSYYTYTNNPYFDT